MVLLEGETLADRLAQGSSSFARMLEYGIRISDALERAHNTGVIPILR